MLALLSLVWLQQTFIYFVKLLESNLKDFIVFVVAVNQNRVMTLLEFELLTIVQFDDLRLIITGSTERSSVILVSFF